MGLIWATFFLSIVSFFTIYCVIDILHKGPSVVPLIILDVRIIPVKKDIEQSVVDSWISFSEWLVFDEQNLNISTKERMEAAVPFIEKAIGTVQENLQETRVLNVADSR